MSDIGADINASEVMDSLTRSLDALAEGVSLSARDEIADLLPRFSDLVTLCNNRLQRCKDLLDRGLRDEAFGYESDDPPALTLFDQLDLSSRPQWEAWQAAIVNNGFPLPSLPDADGAIALREAQETVLKLRPLLDSWRRLNLANAPLSHRMKVLRQLRRKDSNNEAWYSCLASHEQARLMVVERAVQAAINKQDEAALADLAEELTSDWLQAPPRRLVSAAQNALQSLQSRRIDHEIGLAATGLADALARRDLPSAQEHRDRWESLAAQKGESLDDDPNAEIALPALEWVRGHERLAALFHEVWQSLDARPGSKAAEEEWVRGLGRMRDEVEDLAGRLRDDLDLAPVERLRQRVANVEDELRRKKTSRARLIAIGIGSVTLLLLTAGLIVRNRGVFEENVERALGEIAMLEQRIVEGDRTLKELPSLSWSADIANDVGVVAAREKLVSLFSQELSRREDFDKGRSDVDAMIERIRSTRRESPLDVWPPEFSEATTTHANLEARNLAITDEEKAHLARQKGQLSNVATAWQRDAEAYMQQRVGEFQSQLKSLQGEMFVDPKITRDRIDRLQGDVTTLRDQLSAHGAPRSRCGFDTWTVGTKDAILSLGSDGKLPRDIDTVSRRLNDHQRFMAENARLDLALGKWSQYGSQLASIAATFQNDPLAKDYGDAAKSQHIWLAIDSWNNYAKSPPKLGTTSPDQAKGSIKILANLVESTRRLPLAMTYAKECEAVLKQLSNRDPSAVAQTLSDWIEGEWLGGIPFVVREAGEPSNKAFYVLQCPKENADSFKYLTGIKRSDGSWPPERIQSTRNRSFSCQKSPQRVLADTLQGICDGSLKRRRPDGRSYDDVLVDLTYAVFDAKDVDPVLSMMFLRQLFAIAIQSSPVFQTEPITAIQADMDDGAGNVPGLSEAELTSFVAPSRNEDPNYLKASRLAEKLLDAIRSELPGLKERASLLKTRFDNPRLPVFTCIGRLARDSSGRVSFVSIANLASQPHGDAVVFSDDGQPMKVGDFKGEDDLRLSETKAAAGTPVFVQTYGGTR